MLAHCYLNEILVKIKGDRLKGSSYGYNRLENLSPLVFIDLDWLSIKKWVPISQWWVYPMSLFFTNCYLRRNTKRRSLWVDQRKLIIKGIHKMNCVHLLNHFVLSFFFLLLYVDWFTQNPPVSRWTLTLYVSCLTRHPETEPMPAGSYQPCVFRFFYPRQCGPR